MRGMSAVLVTIPFSHYCEKARWALERGGVAYREVGHLPIFSRLGTVRRGRWSTVPLLATDEGVLADSSAILGWIGERSNGWAPYPTARAGEVRALETHFGRALGPHSRRLAYGWLFEVPEVVGEMMDAAPVPAVERSLARAALPAMIALIRRGLKVDDAGVARSATRVDQVFDEVGGLLADGRRYLCGDALTAADLTFAALAAPVLAPPEYGAPLPPVERLPVPARAAIERLRAHPAGRYVARLYREERRRPS
jgi:glutathione S-transferase